MSTRPTLFATVLAVVLASPLAAQRFRIPDSLAYLGMPDDPLEYVRRVVDRVGSMDLYRMYEVGGCASDNGWTTVALDAIYRIAETDVRMRDVLAREFGGELQTAQTRPHDQSCPADLPAFDAWTRNALRRDWETGVVSVKHNRGSTTLGLLRELRYSRNPETHELVRDIAFDPDVRSTIREEAAMAMVAHRLAEKLPAKADMTQEEWLERRFDVLEAMLREHGDDLPPKWVSGTLLYLQYNGKMLEWRLPWLPPVDTVQERTPGR